MSVSCECCVLSARGLPVVPITRLKSPTECGVSALMPRPRQRGGPGLLRAVETLKIKSLINFPHSFKPKYVT